MYLQREKEDNKKATKAHNVIRKKTPYPLEHDPFAHHPNSLLQKQDKTRISAFAARPFLPESTTIQRVDDEDKDKDKSKLGAKAVSSATDVLGAAKAKAAIDNADMGAVGSGLKNAVGKTSTKQAGSVVPDKKSSINPDLAKRLDEYLNWKSANSLAEKPSLKEFQLFDDPFRAKSDFKTYANNEWPPNFGSLNAEAPFTLLPGTKIDRFGSDYGSFLSPVPTSYAERALRPGTLRAPYSVFEVKKAIEVNSATIAPWFGEAGMGIQYRLQGKTIVNDLLGDELKEVYRGPFNGYNN